jgi:hypothetical protein
VQPEANDKFTVQEASFQEKADADGGYGGALDAF